MKHLLRFLSLILSTLLLLGGMGVTALAAPSKTYVLTDLEKNNQEIEALVLELEDKYGITIFYPTKTGENSRQLATIFPETLRTLDDALATVTPGLVRRVSAYYYRLNGRRLTYEYIYADMRGPYGQTGEQEVHVGSFNRKTSRIELYIPAQEGQAIATGDNPLTIVHELAHAVHFMLADEYGYAAMERQWLRLMEENPYKPEHVDETVFVTEYASTEYDEDFAETFAHAFICNRPGLGISGRFYAEHKAGEKTDTPLGKKVAYIERLLRDNMPENLEMLDNYRLVYNTPVSTSVAGLRLSGLHLLFVNMEEPRSVPLMLLNNLPVSERNTVWFPSLGGWYCRDSNGNNLILFPEGTYGNSGRSMLDYKEELDAKLAEDLAQAEQERKEREEERARRLAELQSREESGEGSAPSSQGGTLLRGSANAA